VSKPSDSKAKVIAFAMQKGGVGKSTLSVNVAAGLARGVGVQQHRVLLIDLDPQANATSVLLGTEFLSKILRGAALQTPTVIDLFEEYEDDDTERMAVRKTIHPVDLPSNRLAGIPGGTLDIIPSCDLFAGTEKDLVSRMRREMLLARSLSYLRGDYEVIIIDCPPSLSLLTLNALFAADHVVIPVEPSTFSVLGLNLLLRTIQGVNRERAREGNTLQLMGTIPNMIDKTRTSAEVLALLKDMSLPMLTPIPRRIMIKDACGNECDVFGFATKQARDLSIVQIFRNLVGDFERILGLEKQQTPIEEPSEIVVEG